MFIGLERNSKLAVAWHLGKLDLECFAADHRELPPR
jgi:hypothetical protein